MITTVNEDNFENEVLAAQEIVVIKLFKENCPKCKLVAPIYEKTANENSSNAKFCEFEVVNYSDILREYKVMAVPTFLFFSHGKLIHRKVGVLSERTILNYLAKVSNLKKEEIASKELTGLIDWSFLQFWL